MAIPATAATPKMAQALTKIYGYATLFCLQRFNYGHHLIERVERAVEIAAWDAARKCNELYMILRDKALVWYDSLVDDELDLKDWDVVKKELLKTLLSSHYLRQLRRSNSEAWRRVQ